MICMITSPVRFAISMLVPYLQSPRGSAGATAISIAFALQWLVTAFISLLVGWLGSAMVSAAPWSWGPICSSWVWCSLAA